jgi:hypothetical protein
MSTLLPVPSLPGVEVNRSLVVRREQASTFDNDVLLLMRGREPMAG